MRGIPLSWISIKLALASLALLTATTTPSFAPPVPVPWKHAGPDAVINFVGEQGSSHAVHKTEITVHSDGSAHVVEHVEITIDAGHAFLFFRDLRQDGVPGQVVDECLLRHADGRTISEEVTLDPSASRGFVPNLGQLGAGDALVYTAHSDTSPLIDDGFAYSGDTAWLGATKETYTLIIHTPADMSLYTNSSPSSDIITSAKQGDAYQWVFSLDETRFPPNYYSEQFGYGIHSDGTLGGFLVSTSKSREHLEKDFLKTIFLHSGASSRSRRLADNLTSGTSDQREQAELIYKWIRRTPNTYPQLQTSIAAPRLQAPSEFLAGERGGAADMVLAYLTALHAKGIEAEPVLLKSRQQQCFWGDFLEWGCRTIVWLPGLHSYVDPFLYNETDERPADHFPTISETSSDLRLEDIVRLPDEVQRLVPEALPDALDATLAVQVSATMDAHGVITGESQVTGIGLEAASLKDVIAGRMTGREGFSIEPPMPRALDGTSATGKVVTDGLVDGVKHFAVSLHYETLAIAARLSTAGVIIPTGMSGLLYPTGMSGRIYRPNDCSQLRQTEDLSLVLPPDFRPRSLPAPINIENEVFHYQSEWSFIDRTLKVHREYRMVVDQMTYDLWYHYGGDCEKVIDDYSRAIFLDR